MRGIPAPLAWLACAALLACGEVAAQARGAPVAKNQAAAPDPAFERVTTLAGLDAWLRRLPGRFRITAASQPLGEADCIGIGTGSGVHCIYRFTQPRMNNSWGVEVRLFGLDLDAPGVGYLRLKGDSTAEGGVAKQRGDSIYFLGECPVVQPQRTGMTTVTILSCQQELRVQAPPGKAIRVRTRTTQFMVISPPAGRPRRTRGEFTSEWQLEPMP